MKTTQISERIKRTLRAGMMVTSVMGLLAACGPEGPTVLQDRIVLTEDSSGPAVTEIEAPETALKAASAHADKVTIAILLPLSGSAQATGDAMLNAATLALFDAYDPALILVPYDTLGTAEGARKAAESAVSAGAQLILGPLFADNVISAGRVAEEAGVTMLAFSNDPRAAAPGRYLMGFQVSDEMRRVVFYAREQGLGRFAALTPDGRYGDQVQEAFGTAVMDAGADFQAFARFGQDAASYDDPVKLLADYDTRRRLYRDEVRMLEGLRDDLADEILEGLKNQEVLGDVSFDSLLVAEGGARLRALAPLLPFYEIDPAKVRFLGTGLWYDPAILREPPLQGAWFAAPAPDAPAAFLERYSSVFGEDAPRIATLAYDGFALAAALRREALMDHAAPYTSARFERIEGFSGLDGAVRFFANGLSERALAVLEVRRQGFRVVDPAPDGFPSYGYAVRDEESDPVGR